MTEPTPCRRYRRPLVPQELGPVDRRPTCLPAPPTWEQLVALPAGKSLPDFWTRVQEVGVSEPLTKEGLERTWEALLRQAREPTPLPVLILPPWLIQDR
jgi:hypothetical protein